MRSSATRIVLAALAVIVGVVLALPMLLSRKAEAGAAIPLAADGDGAAKGWVRSRPLEAQRRQSDDGAPDDLSEAAVDGPAPACTRTSTGGERGPCATDFVTAWAKSDLSASARPDALPRPDAIDLEWWGHADHAAALPAPLILVARRQYHLRP